MFSPSPESLEKSLTHPQLGIEPSDSNKYITILQCNIGSAPESRLAKGSTLRNYIDIYEPTIIALTETKKQRKYIPELPGYKFFTLDPLPGSSGGIAFYFKDKIRFSISKAMPSASNSILWIYFQHHGRPTKDLYICVVYAVHSYGSAEKKLSIWKELNGSTTKFQQLPGRRILVGDFNARLGSITGDHATNSNKKYLLDFIHDHSLINLNTIRTFGEYTFHNIKNGDRSIIDYLLTDMAKYKIPVHVILSGSLGTPAQTAHKAIISKISIKLKEAQADPIRVGPRWRKVTAQNKEKFNKSLRCELIKLVIGMCNYKILLSAINRAKTNSLGRARPPPKSAVNATPKLDRLHADFGSALEKYRLKPNLENLNKSIFMENRIREARTQYQRKTLLDFLDKLESLDQINKMRTFYAKIRKKTKNIIDPSFVIWDPNSPRENPSFSSTKDEYLEYWVRYMEITFEHNTIATFRTPMNCTFSIKQDSPLGKEEVKNAINMLKNLKAAGVDEITNEDIKLIESLRPDLILSILQKMWTEERCPDNFRQALIHFFPSPKNLENQRIVVSKRTTVQYLSWPPSESSMSLSYPVGS